MTTAREIPACPEIMVSLHGRMRTSDSDQGSYYGIVHGMGRTLAGAVDAMEASATRLAERCAREAWSTAGLDADMLHQLALSNPGGKLLGHFNIVGIRLADGIVEGQPGWIAYGTLSSDHSFPITMTPSR